MDENQLHPNYKSKHVTSKREVAKPLSPAPSCTVGEYKITVGEVPIDFYQDSPSPLPQKRKFVPKENRKVRKTPKRSVSSKVQIESIRNEIEI